MGFLDLFRKKKYSLRNEKPTKKQVNVNDKETEALERSRKLKEDIERQISEDD